MDPTICATIMHPATGYLQLRLSQPSIGAVLELLNLYVQDGYEVLSAFLIDSSSCLRLPPEAFDGQPIWRPMLQLKLEWQQVLRVQT
ncbi:hypothetical protein [Larkinella rosea]|uniref:Uncharacterized protein n=1 Tax=Larkinella rosea TaxID=2025312 RepID=A0A3P1C3W8_9BACT|nr:hypothetical protein [Larkinella rosea]RRB07726.1 hypothetical protein EHT25_08115 [Larkinella rosea]